jgi:hypothetical protein
MKTVGWVFVAMAAAFLIMVLYLGINFLINSNLKTEAKVLSGFIALIAFGTTIGRLVQVFKDKDK